MDREAALAELQRRGVSTDSVVEAPLELSKTEALNELMRRRPKSWNIAGDPEAFKNQMADVYAKTGISGANRAFANTFGFGPHVENARAAAKEAELIAPDATRRGESVGNFMASLPFYVGGAALTGNPMIGGGLGGAGFGLAQKVEGRDKTFGDVAMPAIGGAVAAPLVGLAGSGLGALARGVGKHAGPVVRAITDPARLAYPRIAQEARRAVTAVTQKGSDKYTQAFKPAIDKGLGTVNPINLGKQNLKSLRKFAANEDYAEAFNRYLGSPTLDNAKKLSSDLWNWTNNYKKLPPGSKTSEGNLIYKSGLAIRKQIEDSIKSQLEKAGGKAAVAKYVDANEFWANNVVGPKYSSLLRRYDAKLLTDEDFVKDIVKSKTGRATLKKIVPDAVYRDLINKTAKWGSILGATALGGKKAFDNYSE